MNNLPGKRRMGLLRRLGRQVGYVKQAVDTVVQAARTDVSTRTLYRRDKIEELPHPDDPKLKLRRTVIDEVIEKKETKS